MPTSKQACQKLKELKGKPSQCGPAQIKKCHGAAAPHPCVPKRRTAAKPKALTAGPAPRIRRPVTSVIASEELSR